MSFARRQRQQLVSALRQAGALAPTACEGWTAQDLAAHLWVREHRLDALPGIGLSRFAGHTEQVQARALHRKGFEGLLEDLEQPPALVRLLDPIVNGVEYYIHHEDVLRPQGERVQLQPRDVAPLTRVALLLARKSRLGKDLRLVVTPTGGHARSFGAGSTVVHVEGPGNELLLHFTGRDADVTIVADDVDAYRAGVVGL
ncbi:maleylpyruvate isomerase family mycothiol-dependent enzyme [uncultured Tessaracoccus sp.]|uniref:maleylpyruvate isomerase family mycothiol-dependent enzyme n=1 Tax=uncultured Tessaracoccus sp. TaxID=905023 RepID=UPI0025E24865|nr:maleylpyruvate isomerase family mycothiol-dependent enzyme [uncultured Tessaracoccus sp.]